MPQYAGHGLQGEAQLSPELLISLGGGICLLLWGSFTVKTAVEKGFAAVLRSILIRVSSSRILAAGGGALSALLMQSATATILLCCSFIGSGIIPLTAAMGIVLGADLGSALAVSILFLDLSLLPPLLLVAGMLLYLLNVSWRMKNFGQILLGLGLMLLAIQWVKQIVAPLTGVGISDAWLSVMLSAPWLAMLVMALVTWFAHSSVVVVLMVASLAQVGVLDAQLSIPMVFGANIGAGLIALPMTARTDTGARSVVLGNILLRCVMALCFLGTSAWWLPHLTSEFPSASALVIALHLVFNLALVIICLPFSAALVSKIKSWLDGRADDQKNLLSRLAGAGLDADLVDNPDRALAAARREAFRMGDIAETMFSRSIDMFSATDQSEIDRLVTVDKEINLRNKAIHGYLSRVRGAVSEPQQEQELDRILQFSSTMENIGDTISHDLARLAVKKISRSAEFSKQGLIEIEEIHRRVSNLLNLAINRFTTGETGKRKQVNKEVERIRTLCGDSVARHRRRLSDRQPSSIGSSSIHQDVVRDFLQVAFFLEHRAER